MQRDRTRQRIGGHVQDLVEDYPRLVPFTGVMTIGLAEVTKRRRICRIHLVRLLVELQRGYVLFRNLRTQATP